MPEMRSEIMSERYVTDLIITDNQFSSAITLDGKFNFSLSGDWVGTVVVQRSFDHGATWVDVAEFEENGEYVGEEVEADVRYRFGMHQGAYSAGEALGRLSQ